MGSEQFQAAPTQARAVTWYQKCRDAGCPRVWSGPGENGVEVRLRGIGDVGLLAGQPITGAVRLGREAEMGSIGTRRRLGECKARHRPPGRDLRDQRPFCSAVPDWKIG